jgi:hypothetical protein
VGELPADDVPGVRIVLSQRKRPRVITVGDHVVAPTPSSVAAFLTTSARTPPRAHAHAVSTLARGVTAARSRPVLTGVRFAIRAGRR